MRFRLRPKTRNREKACFLDLPTPENSGATDNGRLKVQGVCLPALQRHAPPSIGARINRSGRTRRAEPSRRVEGTPQEARDTKTPRYAYQGLGQRVHFFFLPARCSKRKNPPIRRSGGSKRQAAVASPATTLPIGRWSGKVHDSPGGTSRATVAFSTFRQALCAGKPMTASRTRAQAPQVLQVASEYVAGQIAIRLPAGVCRGNGAVRSVFAKSQAQRVAVTAPQNFCTLKDLR